MRARSLRVGDPIEEVIALKGLGKRISRRKWVSAVAGMAWARECYLG